MGLIKKQNKEYKIRLKYWVRGMEVQCPKCKVMVKEPYRCSKCYSILKPYVKMEKK